MQKTIVLVSISLLCLLAGCATYEDFTPTTMAGAQCKVRCTTEQLPAHQGGCLKACADLDRLSVR